MADYYKTLGLAKGASVDEIKKSYRKLAMQYHPDRNPGDKAAEDKFKSISEAYAVLSDTEKRKQYDMFGDRQFHQNYSREDIFRNTDFSSIFEEFDLSGGDNIFSRIFGGGGGFGGGQGFGGQRRGFGGGPAPQGQDVEYPLTIGFMEAFQGGSRDVQFRLSDGTSRSLKIQVPAGARDGGRLRIAGKGAPSPYGGKPGDLFVVFHVQGHPQFERVGDDIEAKLPLRLTEALLGCSKEVSTPEGTKRVKVPTGVKPGTKIRLRGQGFPRPGKDSQGDFFAVVEYDIPPKLSGHQLEAIAALEKVGL